MFKKGDKVRLAGYDNVFGIIEGKCECGCGTWKVVTYTLQNVLVNSEKYMDTEQLKLWENSQKTHLLTKIFK